MHLEKERFTHVKSFQPSSTGGSLCETVRIEGSSPENGTFQASESRAFGRLVGVPNSRSRNVAKNILTITATASEFRQLNKVMTMNGRSAFPTTRWTRISFASDPRNPRVQTALAELLQLYWFPVYSFVRRIRV
jgi:hypothetical protein